MKKTIPITDPINCMLRSRKEVDSCTEQINNYGLIAHPFSCKNFDIMRVVPRIADGNILDMGSSGGSCILENAIRIGIEGRKVGIDMEYESDFSKEGVEYFKGDLIKTTFENEYFQTLCCLSVLEHGISYTELAKESARILKTGGKLFITCDYFDPKVDTTDVGDKLYGLKWNILDRKDVMELIEAMSTYGIKITSSMNWETKEKVINPQFYAPYGKSYTFCAMEFIKA